MPWIGDWPGGRVWQDKKGRKVYFIRRKIRGKPYEVSTRTHGIKQALEHLARFEADPDNYDPNGSVAGPLVLDDELIEAFALWSGNGRGNSADWVRKQRRYLTWWAEQLGGRDLRRVTLAEHIAPALERAPARTHRIEVIKALFGWLRRERHALTTAEDPTYGALAVPQGRPEQWRRPKTIPRAHHEAVLAAIAKDHGDRLMVLAGTGWHVTELMRFAAAGSVEGLPATASKKHGAAAVLVCPRRKSGEMQRTAVSKDVAAAARRVRERGSFSLPRFEAAIAQACAAAKVDPPFSPGQYRHSVATWAIEAGAEPAAVSAFLGHKSVATTRRFYATLAVVPKVPTLA